MSTQKSEALKNFEVEWSKLTDSLIKREPEDYLARTKELISKWGPGMTPEELEGIMRGAMLAMYEDAKRLSKVGQPIAGIDPEHPN
jgi:hypothetical protein